MSKTQILTALEVAGQIPLDAKLYILTLAELVDLGASNVNAFKYYEDMTVFCIESHLPYIWREVTAEDIAEGNEGLIEGGYTYPANAIAYGIDYSGRVFNFFIKQITVEEFKNFNEEVNNIVNETITNEPNQLIEYGFNHVVDFDWYVFAQIYRWDGVRYDTPSDLVTDTVTIGAAPLTVGEKRFDVIVFDINLNFVVIPGDEGINPDTPKWDITTQLYVTTILVEYGTTEPSYLLKRLMYDELTGLPTEFNVSSKNVTPRITLDSPEESFSGAVSMKIDKPIRDDVIYITDTVTFNSGDVDNIIIRILNKAVTKKQTMFLYSYNIIEGFFQGTTQIKDKKYGYDVNNLTTWQTLIIPMTDISTADIHNTGFALTFNNTEDTILYIDEMEIQGNFTDPNTPSVIPEYTLSPLVNKVFSLLKDGEITSTISLADFALLTDIPSPQNANEVPFTPYLTIGATDTQAAVEELKDELDMVSAGSGIPPVEDTYADITELITEQNNQLDFYEYLVTDASDDPTVKIGKAIYLYLGTTVGDLTDYLKVWEEEGVTMDNMDNMSNAKTTPIDADNLTLWDSVTSQFKKVTWANIKATLKTYFDLIYEPIGGGGSEIPIMYNVEDYNVKGDGNNLLDGAITATDATFTSASNPFVVGDVGKLIHIEGAGVSGAYHTTTIASYTGSGEVELTDVGVTTVSGAVFVFGTENTVFLQTAIQAVFDDGGGVLYFKKGIYLLNGALQNNVGVDLINYNSQLYVPDADISDLTRPPIEFLGEIQPNLMQSGAYIAFDKTPISGVILLSTIQGSGTNPSVIGIKGAATNGVANMNYTTVNFKNLAIHLTPNENNKLTMGGINAKFCSYTNFEYIVCYPYNLDLWNSSKPDVIDCSGIILSSVNNEWINTVKNCSVGGFTNGYLVGEHASLYDAIAVCCTNGFTQDFNHHVSTYHKIGAYWCINGFNVIADSKLYINVLNIEWFIADGKWYSNVNTIVDNGNNGIGRIGWYITEGNVGNNPDKFVKIGGDNIQTYPIGVDDLANLQVGTTYAPTILDAHRITKLTNGSAITVTIPEESTLNYDINARLDFYQGGVGQVSFVGEGGVTINTAETLKLRGQYSACSLVKEATDTWIIIGDIELV